MSKELSINRYVLRFGAIYTIGLIILSGIFIIFNLGYSTVASIVIVMGAAFSTASKFVLDQERVPNKKEKSILVWLSFIMSWLVLFLLVIASALVLGGQQALAELGNIFMQVNMLKIIGAVILLSLIYLGVLFFSYGRFAQIQYNAMRKKGRV